MTKPRHKMGRTEIPLDRGGWPCHDLAMAISRALKQAADAGKSFEEMFGAGSGPTPAARPTKPAAAVLRETTGIRKVMKTK